MNPYAEINTKEDAHQFAIEWQHWQSTVSMSLDEVIEWSDTFTALANKFDLTEEFIENGII